MVPDIRSPIAKSAINLECSKPLIDGILDILKDASHGVNAPYMYYYYFDVDEKPLINSFEEKSSAQVICVHSNLGIHTSCILLFLLCIVHNAYYNFFTSRPSLKDPVSWIKWIENFVERDQKVGNSWTKTLVVDSLLTPSGLTRRGKLIRARIDEVEIYTLQNFWEIIHARDYK